ncbi:DUF4129 domain-containing protein [Dictyobacter vulcani]|uniref:DUF4129 domain-containing protein n=1 Tax=Dictyobacter vulcani TaxID=2607529 RepID=UPI001386C7E3|nr:DUF4129 domain-containing protein [Dictyobacter vulcani]
MPDQALNSRRNIFRYLQSGGLALFIQCISVLCIIWASLYSQTTPLWNPVWVGDLLTDIVQLDNTFLPIVGIILVCCIFCYRGIHIARYMLEPGQIMRGVLTGGVILVCVNLLPPASTNEEVYLLLLILLFFSFALLARALAYAIFMRQEHLIGLQGSKSTQDRLIMSTVGLICLAFAVVALILGVTINPTLLAALQQFLSPVGKVYDGIAYAIAWIMTMLVAWIPLDPHFKLPLPKLRRTRPPVVPPAHQQTQVPAQIQSLASMISIVLLIVLIVVFIWVSVIIIRRILNMKRKAGKTVNADLHESLWSWQLFWTQIKAMLLALWRRWRRPEEAVATPLVDNTDAEETAVRRDVRAIYRAFLQWSAGRGYARQRDETPFEFKQRLGLPLVSYEPEMQVVTEVYTATRYGQALPDDAEVERMQQNWISLQRKSNEERE